MYFQEETRTEAMTTNPELLPMVTPSSRTKRAICRRSKAISFWQMTAAWSSLGTRWLWWTNSAKGPLCWCESSGLSLLEHFRPDWPELHSGNRVKMARPTARPRALLLPESSKLFGMISNSRYEYFQQTFWTWKTDHDWRHANIFCCTSFLFATMPFSLEQRHISIYFVGKSLFYGW